jgi:hypothetical protein
MVEDLTEMQVADIARNASSWHEFQTMCRLEMERREYFNYNQEKEIEMDERKTPMWQYVAVLTGIAFAIYGAFKATEVVVGWFL